jgi:hypothetical protein
MHDKFSPPDPSKKAVTPRDSHRRQMIWQVWVPLGASIVIVLALEILAIVGAAQGSPQVDHWGAISAIWVILPVLLGGVLTLAIVGGLAYGVTKLLQKMPDWMLKAQLFMVHLALLVRRASDAATKPVMSANTLSARVSTFWQAVFHRKPSRTP